MFIQNAAHRVIDYKYDACVRRRQWLSFYFSYCCCFPYYYFLLLLAAAAVLVAVVSKGIQARLQNCGEKEVKEAKRIRLVEVQTP